MSKCFFMSVPSTWLMAQVRPMRTLSGDDFAYACMPQLVRPCCVTTACQLFGFAEQWNRHILQRFQNDTSMLNIRHSEQGNFALRMNHTAMIQAAMQACQDGRQPSCVPQTTHMSESSLTGMIQSPRLSLIACYLASGGYTIKVTPCRHLAFTQ